jgi:hypothetical protein
MSKAKRVRDDDDDDGARGEREKIIYKRILMDDPKIYSVGDERSS